MSAAGLAQASDSPCGRPAALLGPLLGHTPAHRCAGCSGTPPGEAAPRNPPPGSGERSATRGAGHRVSDHGSGAFHAPNTLARHSHMLGAATCSRSAREAKNGGGNTPRRQIEPTPLAHAQPPTRAAPWTAATTECTPHLLTDDVVSPDAPSRGGGALRLDEQANTPSRCLRASRPQRGHAGRLLSQPQAREGAQERHVTRLARGSGA